MPFSSVSTNGPIALTRGRTYPEILCRFDRFVPNRKCELHNIYMKIVRVVIVNGIILCSFDNIVISGFGKDVFSLCYKTII